LFLVDDNVARKRLLRVFEPLGLNNLRIIAKSNDAAIRFEKELFQASVSARERILENVIHISAVRWALGKAFNPDKLEDGQYLNFRRGVEDGFKPSSQQEALMATEFVESAADTLIVEYLRSGKIDPLQLREAARVEDRRANKAWIDEIVNRLWDAWHDNFNPIPENATAAVVDLLKGSLRDLEWNLLFRVMLILKHSGVSVDRADVLRRWAKEYEGDLSGAVISEIEDDEARTTLRKRVTERWSIPLSEAFRQMLANDAFNEKLFTNPQFHDPI
jgi:hypothetical protein